MMARSHVILGLVAWTAVAPRLHLPVLDPGCLTLAVAGSLLPDIDHPASWVGRRTRPVSTLIASILGHRGITHSAIALVGLAMLLLHIGYRRSYVWALAVGYLSHLAADTLTPRGLRLAWPFPGSWCIPLCRTGSATEPAIVMTATGILVWWLVAGHLPWPMIGR